MALRCIIFSNLPNINDLVLSLQLYSSDSSVGLISGLPLINPKRVIVVDHGDNILKNQHVEGLVGAILDCVTDWSNLTTVVFPYEYIE
ncbi:hypothetical protein B0H13DRAFT_2051131 [Mycena leptocephala]|nr:hypothetical protein B0H13DRAFT_2051131 [Mycena leptocephala]